MALSGAASSRSATTDGALGFYKRAASFDTKSVELALSLHGRYNTNYVRAVLEKANTLVVASAHDSVAILDVLAEAQEVE